MAGGANDALVSGKVLHSDPRVAGGIVIKYRPHVGLGGGVVDQAELPVRVNLSAYRLDGLPEPGLVRVVHRGDNADEGRVGEGRHRRLHPRNILRSKSVALEPDLVLSVAVLWEA